MQEKLTINVKTKVNQCEGNSIKGEVITVITVPGFVGKISGCRGEIGESDVSWSGRTYHSLP